jgi:plasmid stability protein
MLQIDVSDGDLCCLPAGVEGCCRLLPVVLREPAIGGSADRSHYSTTELLPQNETASEPSGTSGTTACASNHREEGHACSHGRSSESTSREELRTAAAEISRELGSTLAAAHQICAPPPNLRELASDQRVEKPRKVLLRSERCVTGGARSAAARVGLRWSTGRNTSCYYY